MTMTTRRNEGARTHFFDLIVGDPGTGKTWLLLHLSRLYQEAGWHVVYLSIADDRLPAHPGVEEAETLDHALDLAFTHDNSLLAIDELSNEIPSGVALPDERLHRIVKVRRHVRISILGTSQCPWDIHVRVRKLFNRIYYFPMSLEGRKWLEREGVPPKSSVPPAGYYGIFDKSSRDVEMVPYTIDERDWR